MKKEGIQTRNRKLSSKTKRHRRSNGENGNPRQMASASLLYDHNKPSYHGFPSSSSSTSGFPGSFPGHPPPPPPPRPSVVSSHQIPSYMGGGGAAGSLSDSLVSVQTHAFAQNSVNTGYPGAFPSLQGGCSGFGPYFGNGFVGLGGSARFGITSAPTNPC